MNLYVIHKESIVILVCVYFKAYLNATDRGDIIGGDIPDVIIIIVCKCQ